MDKVIAALIKQVQGWDQDPKLDKISKLLLDEREIENPTAEDRKVFRRKAEEIIGPEENLFSVDWVGNLQLCGIVFTEADHSLSASRVQDDDLSVA